MLIMGRKGRMENAHGTVSEPEPMRQGDSVLSAVIPRLRASDSDIDNRPAARQAMCSSPAGDGGVKF
jgi:hypothetical protein